MDSKQLARILVEHTEGKSEKEVQRIMKDFVQFLSENQLLSSWRDIERSIHSIWKEKYGASEVKIVSAHPLSKAALKELEEVAKGADLTHRVDERLIGGAVLRVDDTRIDGSILGSLKRMKQSLLTTTYAK